MKGPKISVITVCYNAANKIESTLMSVIGQSYHNIEYIVIDGGSTDGTLAVLQEYGDHLKWISEPDKGIYDAMNKGVTKATGDWIYFLGAGDILLNILEKVAAQMIESKCIYYGNVFMDTLNRYYDGYFPGYKLAVLNISHQAIFYPATVFGKYRYDLKYKFLADHHLNMLCYGDKDFTFKYLPLTICIYEGNGLSDNNPDLAFYRDKPELIRKNFPFWVYAYTRIRSAFARVIKSKPAYGLD
jgi:glycosyltransferase involved in cell wall biosynthesis